MRFHPSHLSLLFLPGLLLMAGACSTPSILYDYHTKVRFERYQTFSWLESDSSLLLLESVDRLIRDSVSQVLESKGLTYTDGSGDLLVLYHPGRDDRIYPSRYGYTYWPARWGYGGYYQGIEHYEYDEHTLIIDLIDRRTKQLVWRGSAPRVLRTTTTGKLAADAGAALRKMLANFPPPMKQ